YDVAAGDVLLEDQLVAPACRRLAEDLISAVLVVDDEVDEDVVAGRRRRARAERRRRCKERQRHYGAGRGCVSLPSKHGLHTVPAQKIVFRRRTLSLKQRL